MPTKKYVKKNLKKGGNCGCSKISGGKTKRYRKSKNNTRHHKKGGANFFEPTTTGSLNMYPLNNHQHDPHSPSNIESVRTNAEIPFSARGGKKIKKRYCKGGYNDNTNSIANDYIFDPSIVQAQSRMIAGGKSKKKYRKVKGGDMLNNFFSNPVSSFMTPAGAYTSANLMGGQGQFGDSAAYNAPINNPSKFYI